MKYHYREGVKLDKKKSIWILWLLVIIVLAIAAYMAANYIAPQLVSMPLSAKATPDATMNKMQATTPQDDNQHLFIPQLNVDLPIVSGDQSALRDGAWQRDNDGDLEKGIVMTLRAIKFSLGSDPWKTREASPFYNLHKLQLDDEIYVDQHGKRFAFRVKKMHQQPPAEISAPEDKKKSKLVLYPVDERGEFAGGVVVEAEGTGVVAAPKAE